MIIEVTETVAVAEGVGVQVDWINREIDRVLAAQDSHRLA